MRIPLAKRVAPALLAVAVGASACTSGSVSDGNADRDPADLTSDEIILTAGLETVGGCDALLDRLIDEGMERVGPYGFDQGFYGFDDVILEEAAVDEAADSATTAAPALPQAETAGGGLDFDQAERSAGESDDSFTGTNNQEGGVDEADLVKTDGERLIIVSGTTLQVIDVSAGTPRLDKTIQLPAETWGGQLFLDGDRALLMTTGYTERPFLDREVRTDWYVGSPIGRLLEIDLDSGDVVRTLEFEGGYLSAREIDGTIRIVLTATADRFAFVYPSNNSATESAKKANQDLIANSTIDQWLPTYRITEGDQTVASGPIVDCDRVHLPADFAGFGSLIVMTADLSDGFEVKDSVSVFTDAQTVYASTDRVAIATPRWPDYDDQGRPQQDEGYTTALHTFDITDSNRADYVASGAVRGHLLNQYSLSEYDGYLRVATTDGDPWSGRGSSESFVTVFDEDGRALRQIGQVGGLGLGEQIFAVRFIGELGYVVTFEQIDPLYVIDLSDPQNPESVGELKIPGFSSYLHPVDDEHLLGVGMDGTDDGFTTGALVSLFDVSDPSNPTRTAKLKLDQLDSQEGSSYSPVADDAKAFTFWNDLAIVPVSWWEYDPTNNTERNGSDAVLVRVDADGELTEVGRVSHPTTRECEDDIYFEEELEALEAEVAPPPSGGLIPDEDSVENSVDSDPAPQPAPSPESIEEEPVDAEASFTEPEEAPEEAPPAIVEPDSPPSPENYCYTFAPQISRSLVIDNNLYTISEAGVLVNDANSLRDITWIPLQQR